MSLLSAKRLASLVAVGAGALAMGGLPGTASAACVNIQGTGATFQTLAHTNVWTQQFSCRGNVTYTGIGSGAGLNRWKADGTTGAPSGDEWISTDDAPTTTQIANLKAAAGGSSVHVIPVVQAAVSVIVNLPANCSASGGALRADAQKLQDAYDTDGTTFWDLFPSQLSEGVTGACRVAPEPIARNGVSGTTQIFKEYLSVISGRWSGNDTGDTTWPTANVRTIATGGSNMVSLVNGTDGRIGYAVLADAANGGLSGTPGSAGFWVQLPNGGGFADPQVDDGFTQVSNCDGTSYGTTPRTTKDADWSTVFGVNTRATNYPVCGLSYAIAYDDAYTGRPSVTGRTYTSDEGETVARYLQYVTGSASGQVDIASNNYAPLPGAIQLIANAGARDVNN